MPDERPAITLEGLANGAPADPDRGGDPETMSRLNCARDAARKELGA